MNDIQDIAWFAGLFEGEGSFNHAVHRAGSKSRSFRLTVAMSDADVIERVRSTFGGAVCNFRVAPGRKPMYQWTLSGAAGYALAVAIWRFLGERRQVQCRDAVQSWLSALTPQEASQLATAARWSKPGAREAQSAFIKSRPRINGRWG